MDILVTVEGQKMKLSANQKNHIEGSQKFVKFKFDFSSEWTGLKKTAWFIQGNKALTAITSEISEQTGTVYLPNEIKKGQCKLALRGVDPEDGSNVTATTNYILLEIGEDVTQVEAAASDPDSMKLFDTKIKELLNATNETTAVAALGAAVAATAGINLTDISQKVNQSTDEAKGYAAAAAKSANSAKTSESNSAKSEGNAASSANSALNSKTEAAKSATSASTSASLADGSKKAAATSEANAKTSEDNAKSYADNALSSASSASRSETNAATSEANAKNSEGKAKTSETNAANSAAEARESAKSVSGAVEAAQNALEKASALENASNEIIGAGMTYENPADNSALKEIRDIKNEIATAKSATIEAKNVILGSDGGSGYKAELDVIRDDAISAKQQIVGSTGSATQPDTGSALEKVLTAKELIVGKDGTSGIGKEVRNAKNYIIGEDSGSNVYTYVSPADKSALKEIRLAKKYIVGAGNDNTSENPADDSALKKVQNSEAAANTSALSASESEVNAATSEANAKTSEDNAKSYADNALSSASSASRSETNAATSETKAKTSENNAKTSETNTFSAKNEIIGEGGTAANPTTTSALGQIKSVKKEIFGESGTSVEPVDGSALKDMREARKYIVGAGNDNTSENPADDSALAKALDAANRAAESASQAAESATSANKGITVIDSLESNSTANALSANQGRELNQKISDLDKNKLNKTDITTPDYNQNDETQPDYIKNRPCYEVIEAESVIIFSDTLSKNSTSLRLTYSFEIGEEVVAELNGKKFAAVTVEYGQPKSIGSSTESNEIIFTFYADKTQIDLSNYKRTGESSFALYKTKKVTRKKISKYNIEAGDSVGEGYTWPVSGDAVKKYVDEHIPSISEATTSASGLMSSSDKTKLDGIAEGANKTVVDDSLSITSTNPVQNKIVSSALRGKSNTGHGHSISDITNLQTTLDDKASSSHSHTLDDISETTSKKIMTVTERTKLSGIEEGANNYTLPNASATVLGGIKVGTNLSISEDGTLSADAQKMTVDTTITKSSTNAVSSSAVFARIGNLKFVVASEAPTTADENTITLVVEG